MTDRIYAALTLAALFAAVLPIHWLSYQRYRIVKRHGGLGKFARVGHAGVVSVDWESNQLTRDFVMDWKLHIPGYSIIAYGLALVFGTIFAAMAYYRH
ncbi:hypothetical protein [Mesorhizobium sp. B2-1-3A]|uniref:hypothetical protein n=1 Tax=Mesorhizobium sp. B2-1-3A TaxID=2589971 RepID=UPI00112A03AE|nr:hypothetical protein [Mesorhizobium sp. B2-1-3A]TPN01284.1 hypothetical protein FJ977_01900 [Mesorhizobium sp. B2-1-3A]